MCMLVCLALKHSSCRLRSLRLVSQSAARAHNSVCCDRSKIFVVFFKMNDINDDFENMSDEELQEAFAAGILKPGLNIPIEKKVYKNNVEGLKLKLKDFQLNLPWVEKLDLLVTPAPMAPEMHHEVTEKEKSSVVELKSHLKFPPKGAKGNSVALDDLKREMLFHRQAQAAVVEGTSRLQSLSVPTQRPEDYFAQMAKSDEHMHKVRQSLAAKQAGAQRSERVSQLRRMRKLSKQTQIENKLKQQSEKRKMLTEVKNFRKGLTKDLNFLEKDSGKRQQQPGKRMGKNKRTESKDKKFGFGGRKKGSKRNTKESASSSAPGGKAFTKQGGRASMKGGKGKRLGKSRRIKKKGRK